MAEAKRKLTDFDFSKEGCHVSLVDKAANGETVLILKSEEEINKAEVAIKMDVVSFLRTFFGMWTDEAATLAAILGLDQEYFDEDFTFEEFNSLGATEVTLLKAASAVDTTEDSLSEYVNGLEHSDLNTLKAFAESFNNQKDEYENMSENIEKALEAQKVKLEKAAKVELEKALEEAASAKAELAEINKAKEESVQAEFLEKAKGYGAESDDLGLAMAVVSKSEHGLLVLKALEDMNEKLEKALEDEAGFSGDSVEETVKDSPIMKAMKETYKASEDK